MSRCDVVFPAPTAMAISVLPTTAVATPAGATPAGATTAVTPAVDRPLHGWRPVPARAALVGGAVLAAAAVAAFVPDAPGAARDADLLRLMRAMALVKGVLVALAVAAVWWRLARPVTALRLAGYVALPVIAAAATAAMWRMVVPGTIAVLLHAAGVALVVLAWRDPAFLPTTVAPRRR